MKKKAFTFAELMISLVVIAIITAILYPTVSELSPNNNKQLFKSAYKTIELVVSEITASGDVPAGAADLCKAFKSRLNFVPRSGVTDDGVEDVCASDNQFQTSNGMRWAFLADGVVVVDVNATNNQTTSACEETTVKGIWASGSFCGGDIVQDSFAIEINSNGKVEVASSVGRRHLIEDTED